MAAERGKVGADARAPSRVDRKRAEARMEAIGGSRYGREAALVAVLAGGEGSRIGGEKACVPLAGRPLISHPVAAARSAGLETLVVAKRESELPSLLRSLGCEILIEPDLPRHPLCGIVAALSHADGRPVLTLGCDMPFLTSAFIGWMARSEGALVLAAKGRVHPIVSRWIPPQLQALEDALAEQLPMREVIAALEPRTIEEDVLQGFGDPSVLCFNVNDLADLERARALANVG